MLGGLGMTTLIVVLSMVNPQISGMIVDDVIHGGESKKLLPLVGLMLLTTAFISILRYCHQIIYEKASQGVLYDMRNKVYRKLLQEDFQFYNRKRTGDLMSRQTGDMDAIRHFVAYTIYVSYQYALYFIFALTMIFTINTKLAWAMLTVTVRLQQQTQDLFSAELQSLSSSQWNRMHLQTLTTTRKLQQQTQERYFVLQLSSKPFNSGLFH